MGLLGAGTVFTSPLGETLKFSYRLDFEATNNVAEDKALFLGLELAIEMGIKVIQVIQDSNLVVSQVKDHFKVKDDRLRLYKFVV
jgi:ribonuclease HI